MRRKKVEPVGNVISMLLRETGLETPLNESRAVNAWPLIVGGHIAKSTRNIRIYNQMMFVEVSSPALRNNLFMQRAILIKKINDFVKARVISDIRFE